MAARRAKVEAGRAATGNRLTGRRAMALLIVLSLGLSAGVLRLTQVQAVSASQYEKLGAGQRIRKINLAAERGAIFDRNGVDLAISIPQRTPASDTNFDSVRNNTTCSKRLRRSRKSPPANS